MQRGILQFGIQPLHRAIGGSQSSHTKCAKVDKHRSIMDDGSRAGVTVFGVDRRRFRDAAEFPVPADLAICGIHSEHA